MNTPIIQAPTEQELDQALEIISRSAKARKASGANCPERLAFQKQRQENQALAAECTELQEVIYRRLADALPDDLRELFGLYSLVAVAPYAVSAESFQVFQQSTRKAKKLLSQQQ